MFFAVGTVFLLLIGVLTNNVNLASGMLIHELSVLLVILNAIRLVRFPSLQFNFRKSLGMSGNVEIKELKKVDAVEC